jgi:hypothetical protein
MKRSNLLIEALGGKTGRTIRTQENSTECHNLLSVSMRCNMGRNQPRITEHIVVEKEHQFTLRGAIPGIAGSRQATVLLFDHTQATSRFQPFQCLGRSIAGSVNDNDDFEPIKGIGLREQSQESAEHQLSPIEGGKNYRNIHRSSAPSL